jgi:hypothetical protein
MSDANHGAGTPEAIAYALMQNVMQAEERELHLPPGERADRAYLLDLYAECVKAARGLRIESEQSVVRGTRKLQGTY